AEFWIDVALSVRLTRPARAKGVSACRVVGEVVIRAGRGRIGARRRDPARVPWAPTLLKNRVVHVPADGTAVCARSAAGLILAARGGTIAEDVRVVVLPPTINRPSTRIGADTIGGRGPHVVGHAE